MSTELRDKVVVNFKTMAKKITESEGNQFRARAYWRAAQIIGNMENDWELVDLTTERVKIKGIGPSSIERIRYLRNHSILLELVPEDLPTALGEPAPSPAPVLRHPAAQAHAVVDPVMEALRATYPQAKFEVVGSLRRHAPDVHDIDIVATAETEALRMSIMQCFRLMLTTVTASGSQKVQGTRDGIMIEIRVIPPKMWASTLIHATGSAEFNIEMRRVLTIRGFHFSERGIWVEGGSPVNFETEQEYFDEMGLEYLEPCNRYVRNMRWTY